MFFIQKILLKNVKPWSFKINACLSESVFCECIYAPQNTISWWFSPPSFLSHWEGIIVAFLWHTPVINLRGSWGQKPFPQLRHTERINLLSAILSETGYYNLTVDWNLAPFNFTEPGRGAVSRPLLPFALLYLLHDQRWWDNWIPSHSQGLEVAFVVDWLRLSYIGGERKIKLEFFFPKTNSTGGAIFCRMRLSVVPGASGPSPGKSSWKMRICLCFHIRLSHLRLSLNGFWKMPCSNMLD